MGGGAIVARPGESRLGLYPPPSVALVLGKKNQQRRRFADHAQFHRHDEIHRGLPVADRRIAAGRRRGGEPVGDVRGGLWTRSFLGLLATQFLVALNDNMFRWLIVPIGKALLGARARRSGIVDGAGLPRAALYFSGRAGRLPGRPLQQAGGDSRLQSGRGGADDSGHRGSILQGNLYLMYGVLTLMGTEAALFSPARMGCLPEIVRADRLSAANGLMGLTTIVAIIGGTVAGGVLFSLSGPDGGRHWGISAAALIGVALAGLAASLCMAPLRAANPRRRFPVNAVGPDVARPGHAGGQPGRCCWRPWPARSTGSWPPAAKSTSIAWRPSAWAWTSNTSATCWPVLAVGVGLGSALAGVWSAGKIELGMVPWAAAGMAASCLLLYLVPGSGGTPRSAGYLGSCLGLLALGFSAGFFDVPLQAFLQHRSPPAVAGVHPGRLQLHHLLRHVVGRRHLLGPQRSPRTSPPGKSSSWAAWPRCRWLFSVPACWPWRPSASPSGC